MRNLFNSWLLATLLLVFIVGCRQQGLLTEETRSGQQEDLGKNTGQKPKKQVRFATEPLSSNVSCESPQSKEVLPLPIKEGENSFSGPTREELEKDLPPSFPTDELLPPPVAPMNIEQPSKGESVNQEERAQHLQDASNNNGQKEHITPMPSSLPDEGQASISKLKRSSSATAVNAPIKPFPTISKLNEKFHVDISRIDLAALEQKSILTLEAEFKEIQQAYETVKRASADNDKTEEARSLLTDESSRINKPRTLYYNCIKSKVKKEKEASLTDTQKQLAAKQAELTELNQDIENNESNTVDGLSQRISDMQAALTELEKQKPKFSQFKGDLQAFNQAKKASEDQIDEKVKDLKVLQQQERSIKQQLDTQHQQANNLEKEIAQLQKEEPKRIEEQFTKQLQELDRMFGKQANVKEEDIKEKMFKNVGKRINQIRQRLEEREKAKKAENNLMNFEQDFEPEVEQTEQVEPKE